MWDLASGSLLHTFAGHTESVDGVAVTPDGQCAVSVCLDKTLKVWDLAAGTLLATFHGEGAMLCCAQDPPNRVVAGDKAGRVYILALEE